MEWVCKNKITPVDECRYDSRDLLEALGEVSDNSDENESVISKSDFEKLCSKAEGLLVRSNLYPILDARKVSTVPQEADNHVQISKNQFGFPDVTEDDVLKSLVTNIDNGDACYKQSYDMCLKYLLKLQNGTLHDTTIKEKELKNPSSNNCSKVKYVCKRKYPSVRHMMEKKWKTLRKIREIANPEKKSFYDLINENVKPRGYGRNTQSAADRMIHSPCKYGCKDKMLHRRSSKQGESRYWPLACCSKVPRLKPNEYETDIWQILIILCFFVSILIIYLN